jgi:MFS family permease
VALGQVKFANFTVTHHPMSWKIALLVALLTGIITAVVTAPVADGVTKRHGVSDFEGGRGMAIAFVLIPAGFIGGFLVGLLGTKLVHAVEWAQFWKALGLSALLGQAALWGVAGLSLLSIPRAPLLDGETLALQVEVSIPLDRVTPGAREPNGIRLSLYAGDKDNHYADIDRAGFREVNGMLVVTALAGLNSTAPFRTLSFHIEDHTWLAYDLTALPAVPTAKDLEWSEPRPMRDAREAGRDAAFSDVLLRHRVVKQGPPAR